MYGTNGKVEKKRRKVFSIISYNLFFHFQEYMFVSLWNEIGKDNVWHKWKSGKEKEKSIFHNFS